MQIWSCHSLLNVPLVTPAPSSDTSSGQENAVGSSGLPASFLSASPASPPNSVLCGSHSSDRVTSESFLHKLTASDPQRQQIWHALSLQARVVRCLYDVGLFRGRSCHSQALWRLETPSPPETWKSYELRNAMCSIWNKPKGKMSGLASSALFPTAQISQCCRLIKSSDYSPPYLTFINPSPRRPLARLSFVFKFSDLFTYLSKSSPPTEPVRPSAPSLFKISFYSAKVLHIDF